MCVCVCVCVCMCVSKGGEGVGRDVAGEGVKGGEWVKG